MSDLNFFPPVIEGRHNDVCCYTSNEEKRPYKFQAIKCTAKEIDLGVKMNYKKNVFSTICKTLFALINVLVFGM
jgi:hypothetical protein